MVHTQRQTFGLRTCMSLLVHTLNYSILLKLSGGHLKNVARKLLVILLAHLFILKHYITSYSRKIHMKELDSTFKRRAMNESILNEKPNPAISAL